MYQTNEKKRCTVCKKVAIKLVPLEDNDNKHLGIVLCCHCKRTIKKEQIRVIKNEIA